MAPYYRPAEKHAVRNELTQRGHLVLSRKSGESLTIGDAQITLLRIRGGTVRLGIEAPLDMAIVRGELDPWQGKSVEPQPAAEEEADCKMQNANCKLQNEAEHAA